MPLASNTGPSPLLLGCDPPLTPSFLAINSFLSPLLPATNLGPPRSFPARNLVPSPLLCPCNLARSPLLLRPNPAPTPSLLASNSVQSPLLFASDTFLRPVPLDSNPVLSPMLLAANGLTTPLPLARNPVPSTVLLGSDSFLNPLLADSDSFARPPLLDLNTIPTPLLLASNPAPSCPLLASKHRPARRQTVRAPTPSRYRPASDLLVRRRRLAGRPSPSSHPLSPGPNARCTWRHLRSSRAAHDLAPRRRRPAAASSTLRCPEGGWEVPSRPQATTPPWATGRRDGGAEPLIRRRVYGLPMAKPAPDDHDSATCRRLFAPNDRSTGKQAEHHSALT